MESAKTIRTSMSKRGKTAGVMLALGLVAAVAFSLAPVLNSAALDETEGGDCSLCHNGPDTDSLLTHSGVPSSYTPGNTYTITIQITDGAGTQSFDLIVSAGTLSNPSTNAEINSATEASANDGVDLSAATTFTVDWTAPSSGSVTFDFWGVSGNGASAMNDPWDHDTVSIADVPEFPTLLLPVMGMLGGVFAITFMGRKAKK
ncbi:MAG: hypothetical protein MUC90_07635 [Thermoplasmata archaeon]|jgi:hypothetical protein|nr:hypothetical protein [Thermoplasmata archaeon]